MKINPKKAAEILAQRKGMQKPFILEEFLFKEQIAFVRDQARYSTAVCSTRAGKTTACAADLIDTALTMPGTIGLYITLARSSAKRIVWPELTKILREYNIKAKTNTIELSIKFPNGSIIYCTGASTDVEVEKLRGLSNVALVYIDESQAFRAYLKDLIDDVIAKRLYDTNGRLRMIGTPGPIPAGFFYESSQSPNWSHHAWTMHNNPWLEKKSGMTVAQLIQQDMDRRGVSLDHPSIQRENFGRWVLDPQSLLLEYNTEKNHFDTLPEGKYNYILGIDLGFDDSDSLSVIAWRDNSHITYLVEEIVTDKQTIESLLEKITDIMKRYPIAKMVADTGGLGKKIVESLKQRWALPIEAADKTRKLENYALLNNSLRTGAFLAKKTSKFAQDCNLLERDKDKSTPDRIVVKGHSDAVDSVLYAFKESPAYGYTPPVKGPQIGSPEWAVMEHNRMREETYNQIIREQELASTDEFGLNAYENQIDLDKWKKV